MTDAVAESRLERMIARLATQRALLDRAAEMVANIDGPILEIGLGKGRTFSHLRGLFPDREIWAFDFEVHAAAHSRPAPARIVLGDFRETLLTCWTGIEGPPAFVHADIGTESRRADAALARFVGSVMAQRLAPGGILLGDRDMDCAGLIRLEPPAVALPEGISAWPYRLYRR
ncbi:MAG: hypothetical protein OXC10_18360 [Rhodospirillaceae bacterium]|nr:hypothetical protein [Rhodospirillaceae bacterium]